MSEQAETRRAEVAEVAEEVHSRPESQTAARAATLLSPPPAPPATSILT